jgi:hypothetical protein
MSSLGHSVLELNIIGGVIMKQREKTVTKKVAVSVNIGEENQFRKRLWCVQKRGRLSGSWRSNGRLYRHGCYEWKE